MKSVSPVTQCHVTEGASQPTVSQRWKERKGKEEYLYSLIYTTHSLKAFRRGSHSFTCKLHDACLSFI